MSLSKETITHIENNSKAGNLVVAKKADFEAIILPNDMSIHSTEFLQEFKNRFTGHFSTDSIKSFAEYVNKQDEKICFVDSREPMAKAIFDMGTTKNPLHCKHKAFIELSKTANFKSLNKFCSNRADQIDLAEFIEDYRFCVTATNDTGEEMETNKAIMAIRKITINANQKTESEVKTFSTNKSTNELIEANSQGDPLPAWITFSCIPYHGLTQRDFPMRVQASVSRGEISFNMKVQNYEKIIEETVEEFKELVAKAIDSKTEIFVGNFKD